jgi:hypothetical protein
MASRGFDVKLREEVAGRTTGQWLGMGYAALCKAFGLEKAFGHTNPYHRHAFPIDWWRAQSEGADLAVINYSYWARLPCACPKAVVLHDLLSDAMWGGTERETEELRSAALVVAISIDEERRLRERGIRNVLWSPPIVPAERFDDSEQMGLTGSCNRFNVEGLRWLERGLGRREAGVHLYGPLGRVAQSAAFVPRGSYADRYLPYRECGIVLLPTALGTGVQIKAVEALACGRAIVARRGAMRGLPPSEGAWIEVSTPEEMVSQAESLQADRPRRHRQCEAAQAYYDRHLRAEEITRRLREAYEGMGGTQILA